MDPLAEFMKTCDLGFKAIGYGRTKMEVVIHKGEPVYFVSDDFSTQKYSHDGTVEATKMFLEEYQKAVANKESGTFTFTVRIQSGSTKESHLQKNYKRYI